MSELKNTTKAALAAALGALCAYGVQLLVPVLVLVVGLWLGTPVYSEFRYAYPIILTAPLVLMTTLYSPEK